MSLSTTLRRHKKMLFMVGIVGALMLLAHALPPSSFTPGNLVVLRMNGTTSAAAEVLLDEFTTAGVLVQTLHMPSVVSGSNRILTGSASATSEGALNLSTDGRYLTLSGYDSAIGTAGVATSSTATTNRIIGRVDANLTIDTSTHISDAYNQSSIRGAVTDDGTRFWTGGTSSTAATGGVRIVPFGNAAGTATTQISATTTNVRVPNIFNGQLYVSSGSGASVGVNTVGSGLPTASGSAMALIAGSGNVNGFVLLDRDATVPGLDTLYIADQTSGLVKFSFNGTTWTSRGAVAGNLTGITGVVNGSTAVLYATSGTSAANTVVTFTDTAAFNANIVASATTLTTAPASTIFRGIAFAPHSATAVAPSITQNPGNQTILTGQTAMLSVSATGTPAPTYQWYAGNSGDTVNSTLIGGATSSTYTTPALTSTASYWVRVTNSQGTADSTTATVTVTAPVAPSISQNPGNQAISSGQTAMLSVTATGIPAPTYQWYVGNSGDTSTPIGGATNSTYTTPALTSTTSYWVRVTNSQGTADSTTATIMVISSTAPTGTGSAVPSAVPPTGTTTLTVTVTPGANPPSTGLSVVGDLSSIGGSSTQAFSGSGNTFTFSATVDGATTQGSKSLPITVSDAQTRSSGSTISLMVTAPLANSTVVISQIYAGGGNSASATYSNDYVQLYNRGAATVDLTGWSLQYAAATGTGDWASRQPLGGTIDPGHYYLVSLASGGTSTTPLPQPNVSGQINMGQSAGKIALVDNGDLLTGTGGCSDTTTHIRDLVGWGTTANCFEGTNPATVSAPLTTTALFRLNSGTDLIDTNDNKADFVTGTPNPFTTTPITTLPPSVFTTYPSTNGTDIPRDATIEVTFTEAITVDSGWFDITCATTGQHNDATEVPDGTNRWITPNVNFLGGESCTVTVFKTKVHDSNSLSPSQDYSWTFIVAAAATPPETPDVHLLMGNPTNATADVSQPNNYLMVKPEYSLSYNRDLGRPNWVSWHLTNAWIPVSHPARVDTFRPDPAVPTDWYRVQSFDFSGSGFDRGHMSPNADRENSIPDNQATFLMSNMVAQAPDNNQGPWADFENYLRTVVRSSTPNEIYIVSGPQGTGGAGSSGAATTLAGGHVTVPAYTWKVALVLSDNGTNDDISRVNCSTTTVAVIMPNSQGTGVLNRSDLWPKYLTTVSAVETLTGYQFFTNLPQPVQNCIKAGLNGANSKNDQTITFTPLPATASVGDSIPLQATASSGLPVTLMVTAGPATIVSGVLHVTGTGMVTVQATQTGDVNYNAATPVSSSVVVQPADVTSQVTLTNGSFLYTRGSGNSVGSIVIKNVSASPIAAPLQLVITGATASATVVGATGKVPSGAYAGMSYITVSGNTTLAPGASVTVPLTLHSPGIPAGFVPKLLSGGF